jgi:hypothetical protein
VLFVSARFSTYMSTSRGRTTNRTASIGSAGMAARRQRLTPNSSEVADRSQIPKTRGLHPERVRPLTRGSSHSGDSPGPLLQASTGRL